MKEKKIKGTISKTFYDCDRCHTQQPAFYLMMNHGDALWIQCRKCGKHAAPYIPNLPLEEQPATNYRGKIHVTKKLESKSFDKAFDILAKQSPPKIRVIKEDYDYDNTSWKRPYYPDSPIFSYNWKTFSPITKTNQIAAHTLL